MMCELSLSSSWLVHSLTVVAGWVTLGGALAGLVVSGTA